MLRTQLARSAARAASLARSNAARTFAGTPSRQAEVELTVGTYLMLREIECITDTGVDGKKVSIEGGLLNKTSH